MNGLLLESMAEERRRDLARAAAPRPHATRRRLPPVPAAVWFFGGWILGALLRG